MNGSMILSDEEKRELVEDAKDKNRGKVFNAARALNQESSLDDYIDFLSENIDFIELKPTRKVTKHFKL